MTLEITNSRPTGASVHSKSQSFRGYGVFIILAVSQFCACSTAPKPPAKIAPKSLSCAQKAAELGLVCIDAIIPYENAFDVKVEGRAKSYSIPEATRLDEDDLIFMQKAFDEKLPVRLILKGDRILGVKGH